MDFIAWILFGLIIGVIANTLDEKAVKGGLVGSIVLGIAGALVGGFLANLVFEVGVTGFNVTSFVVAIGGALILLSIGRALRKA